MQRKSDSHLEAQLDKNLYDESHLLELKIPVNLPYQISWSSFERYDGEIELNGILYKYVKRKVNNDTLYLMCIPNQQKMELQTAKNDFFKNTNDLNQGSSKKTDNSKSTSFKKLINDFDEHSFALYLNINNNAFRISGLNYQDRNLLTSPHISPEQPPELQLS